MRNKLFIDITVQFLFLIFSSLSGHKYFITFILEQDVCRKNLWQGDDGQVFQFPNWMLDLFKILT